MRERNLSFILGFAAVLACEEGSESGESAEAGGATSAGTTGAIAPTSGGGPPPGAVSECRDVCDFLQQFGCIDADLHEVCWDACAVRSEGDIELFIACEDNALGCETGCLENFLDADPVTPGDTGESTPPSCVEACSEFLGMGCNVEIGGFGSCTEFCASLDEQQQEFAVMCIEDADGCELPPQCMFPDGG